MSELGSWKWRGGGGEVGLLLEGFVVGDGLCLDLWVGIRRVLGRGGVGGEGGCE